MNNFNLDIHKYSCNDLIDLLSLPINYDESTIISAKKKLQKKLIQIDNADFSKINDILLFLDNAKNKLIQELNNNNFKGTYEDKQNNVSFYGDKFIINNNNEIQGKKANTWDGKNTNDNYFPPGYLNPLNIKSITKVLNIDTRFRPEYFLTKSTDFTITLPEKINKVVSMTLSYVELPMTFYSISETLQNTTFKITANSIEYIIKLPSGNYENRWVNSSSAAFIESAVNSALDRIMPAPPIIKFTIDPVSGRGVFANILTQTTPFQINFNVDNEGRIDNSTPLMFRLGWQLGFRAGEYKTNNIGAATAYVSEGICMINGPQYAYISINDYNNSSNNFFTAAFSESILSPNIIGRVNITYSMQENKVYKTGSDNDNIMINRTKEYFGPVDIQKLSVQLLDEYGRVIDLNNMDWSFLLTFTCLYD